MSTTTRRTPLHALAAVTATVLVAAMLVLVPAASGAQSADALTPQAGNRVVRIAASKRGAPYQWGAAGPRRFDCSGLTQWVFGRIGKRLPRTAASQARATRRISAGQRRRGDLVFFHSGGRVYHVGIYAGRNKVWHSPRPGRRVSKERIWTGSVRYGRVR